MRGVLVLAAAILTLGLIQLGEGGDARAEGCGSGVFTGGAVGGGVGVGGQTCGSTAPPAAAPAGSTSGPTTRSTVCDASNASSACQAAIASCTHAPLPAPTSVVVREEQRPDGTWQQVAADCDGDGAPDALAVVTAAMVREQVVRLLPPVAVGVAPANGPTLVNMETVFWAPTATTRQLGPVTILGQSVAITIRFDHATYDFGDGISTTVDTPGTPWTRDACGTAQCPTLDGHTYTATADALTARCTITWTATFTVAGGAAQPIPGTIDGPTATHDLQVLEGRSVILR